MRAILSAPGSRGDVNPMIAIGRRLREAGHDVVISLAEPYADVAVDAGLEVEVVIGHQQFTEALGNPHVWKPIRGPLKCFVPLFLSFWNASGMSLNGITFQARRCLFRIRWIWPLGSFETHIPKHRWQVSTCNLSSYGHLMIRQSFLVGGLRCRVPCG